MKPMISLDSKDVREIIARFLEVRIEDVIPNRYNFSVSGLTAEQIEAKIRGKNHDRV